MSSSGNAAEVEKTTVDKEKAGDKSESLKRSASELNDTSEEAKQKLQKTDKANDKENGESEHKEDEGDEDDSKDEDEGPDGEGDDFDEEDGEGDEDGADDDGEDDEEEDA